MLRRYGLIFVALTSLAFGCGGESELRELALQSLTSRQMLERSGYSAESDIEKSERTASFTCIRLRKARDFHECKITAGKTKFGSLSKKMEQEIREEIDLPGIFAIERGRDWQFGCVAFDLEVSDGGTGSGVLPFVRRDSDDDWRLSWRGFLEKRVCSKLLGIDE